MTADSVEFRPSAALHRDHAYYRQQADLCAEAVALLRPDGDPEFRAQLVRDAALWAQMADELDAYLTRDTEPNEAALF